MKYKKLEIIQQIVTVIAIFLPCFKGCRRNNNSNNLWNKMKMIMVINKCKCSKNEPN
jgi:hypothetical protein